MTNYWKNAAAVALAAIWFGGGETSAQVTLKLATMAPDGSIWMQALADAKTEVETATGGAVKLIASR